MQKNQIVLKKLLSTTQKPFFKKHIKLRNPRLPDFNYSTLDVDFTFAKV